MVERFFAFGKFKGFVFGSEYDALTTKFESLKAELAELKAKSPKTKRRR